MTGINLKQYSWAILPFIIVSSQVYAERSGFYTIVGPDGRIMVIDRNAAVPAAENKKKQAVQATPASTVSRPAAGVQADHLANATVAAKPEAEIPKASIPTQSAPVSSTVPSASAQPLSPLATAKLPAAVQTPVAPVPASKPSQGASGTTAAASSAGAATEVSAAVNVPVPSASSQKPPLPVDNANEPANPVTVIDGEQYIQSEYLEQKEFNLDGKKRFYSLPDGLGGTQVLQREKGVDMNVFRGPQVAGPKVVTLSKDYQRMEASQVVALTGVQCFTPEQLEKAKSIKEKATVDFWPRPSFEPKFDFVIAKFEVEVSDIELTSYAATSRNPVFYWPLPVFLDKNACVMEGVNAFYQRTLNANSMQHQALQGFLHVPQGARYLLLTPLEAAADLTQVKLTNKGQVRLTPIR